MTSVTLLNSPISGHWELLTVITSIRILIKNFMRQLLYLKRLDKMSLVATLSIRSLMILVQK